MHQKVGKKDYYYVSLLQQCDCSRNFLNAVNVVVLLMFGFLYGLTYGWVSRLYLQLDDRSNIPTSAPL